jgi:catechol 2,3-dioxygenase-like lactoylglutathione lyase family enzyme
MEQMIAKLLHDFEQGRMSRRQLIQSLALAATAATPAASAAGMDLKAIAVNHISYHVANHVKVRDFYTEVLGMKVLSSDEKRSTLSFGNTGFEIGNRPANRWGIDHIGYTIDNWNRAAVEAELKRRGVKPLAFSTASQAWIPVEEEAGRSGAQPPPPEDTQEITIKDPEGLPVQIMGRFSGQ